jgi:hypothetical protein
LSQETINKIKSNFQVFIQHTLQWLDVSKPVSSIAASFRLEGGNKQSIATNTVNPYQPVSVIPWSDRIRAVVAQDEYGVVVMLLHGEDQQNGGLDSDFIDRVWDMPPSALYAEFFFHYTLKMQPPIHIFSVRPHQYWCAVYHRI